MACDCAVDVVGTLLDIIVACCWWCPGDETGIDCWWKGGGKWLISYCCDMPSGVDDGSVTLFRPRDAPEGEMAPRGVE